MRFTSAIASAVLAATALAAPSTSFANIPSIADAQAHGIDVFGPIPSDAVKTPEGYYSAEEGTQAWRWIRAQIDIPPGAHAVDDKLAERQAVPSNVGIAAFSGVGCTNQVLYISNVNFDTMYSTPANTLMFSIGIALRGLKAGELLSFYGSDGVNLCGQARGDAPALSPVGCQNSAPASCLKLTTTAASFTVPSS